MKNKEITDTDSMCEKIDPGVLSGEFRKALLETLEADLQNYAGDPQGQAALMIAIKNLKDSLN